jgi:hypothetical protein
VFLSDSSTIYIIGTIVAVSTLIVGLILTNYRVHWKVNFARAFYGISATCCRISGAYF